MQRSTWVDLHPWIDGSLIQWRTFGGYESMAHTKSAISTPYPLTLEPWPQGASLSTLPRCSSVSIVWVKSKLARPVCKPARPVFRVHSPFRRVSCPFAVSFTVLIPRVFHWVLLCRLSVSSHQLVCMHLSWSFWCFKHFVGCCCDSGQFWKKFLLGSHSSPFLSPCSVLQKCIFRINFVRSTVTKNDF